MGFLNKLLNKLHFLTFQSKKNRSCACISKKISTLHQWKIFANFVSSFLHWKPDVISHSISNCYIHMCRGGKQIPRDSGKNSNTVRKSGMRNRLGKRDRFRDDRNATFHSSRHPSRAMFPWKLHADRSSLSLSLLCSALQDHFVHTRLESLFVFRSHFASVCIPHVRSNRRQGPVRISDNTIWTRYRTSFTMHGCLDRKRKKKKKKKERVKARQRWWDTCTSVRVNVQVWGGAWRDIMQIKYSWLSGLVIWHAFIFRDE